jgi:hypothetical protein
MTEEEADRYCDPTARNWNGYWFREWRQERNKIIVTTIDEYGETTEEVFCYEHQSGSDRCIA